MKQILTATMFALAMVSASTAMATNKTCPPGHQKINSCNGDSTPTPTPSPTPPVFNGGQGGAGGSGVGVGVGFGGNATGGSVVNSGNSFVNTKGTVGDVTANGGAGGNASSSSSATGVNVGGIGNKVLSPEANATSKVDVDVKNDNRSSAFQTQGQSQSAKTGDNVNINIHKEADIPTETTVNQNVHYSGEYKVKNVPNVAGPALTSSNDTCMGSTSGGVAVAGFGLSLGSTWSDKNCLMLKNSRELWNMGFKAAAMARMCMDDLNKEALELTGFVCPTKKAE